MSGQFLGLHRFRAELGWSGPDTDGRRRGRGGRRAPRERAQRLDQGWLRPITAVAARMAAPGRAKFRDRTDHLRQDGRWNVFEANKNRSVAAFRNLDSPNGRCRFVLLAQLVPKAHAFYADDSIDRGIEVLGSLVYAEGNVAFGNGSGISRKRLIDNPGEKRSETFRPPKCGRGQYVIEMTDDCVTAWFARHGESRHIIKARLGGKNRDRARR